MLYIYYMKIKYPLFLFAFLCMFSFPGAWAQVTVVKQDGQKIYLDTSDFNRNVSVGDTFKIILSKEKLTNPKTGKELGQINHYSAEGKIIEVQPLYVVGQMPDKTKFSVGQEAVIEAPVTITAAVPAPSAQPASNANTPAVAANSNRKMKTYPVLEREIISAVQTDLSAQPGEEIAALDTKGNLILYTPDTNSLQELASYKLNTGLTPITLSALDLMETGYAQLFAAVYKESEQRIVTLVFDVQDHAFKLVTTLPYFVKELGCGDEKEIYAQRPFISGTKPGDAHELEYENGRFKMDKDTLFTRNNWLTGINEYKIQNKDTDNLVYTASNGRLRLRLQNGKYVESAALFATAPNRVKYKQQLVSFYPSLQVYGPEGRSTLAAVENKTSLGLLSEQFGQYKGSKLHFLSYENGSLKVTETLDLDGFLYDTNCTARGILAPQVLSSKETVLTEIYR